MTPGAAAITAVASVLPPPRSQHELWNGFFAAHFRGVRWAELVYRSAGVNQRHPAVDPTIDDVSKWTTAARLQRYLAEAMPLAKGAAARALAIAGLDASDVGLLAVVSCTGYSTPGVDVAVARDLGLRPNTERLLIGHMGCHAALPALGLAADYVASRGRPALLLCVELPSLHIQPPSKDVSDVLAHALFSDAAAAIIMEPAAGPGSVIVDIEALTDVASAGHITWEITDMGFRMTLSRTVPNILAGHVGPTVDTLLGRHGLKRSDVAAWGVHPGGPRVLDAVGAGLDLPKAALDVSRDVLAEYGNCSSATVLIVLQELQRRERVREGQLLVLLAFGPGLTLYAVLLRSGSQPTATSVL
jgi:predicted naringenin-chalcone synthase